MKNRISIWPLAIALLALPILPACQSQPDRPRVLGVARAAEAPDESVASPLHEVRASSADAVPLVQVDFPSGKITTAADNLAASTQAITASGANLPPATPSNTTILTPTGTMTPHGTTDLRPTGTRP